MTSRNLIFILLFFTLIVPAAFAQRGGGKGGFSMGVLGGITNAEQKHLNVLRERSNIRAGGISASDLDKGFEFGLAFDWKSDFLGFQIRPSYFTQSEGSGAYEYKTKATTVAGIFRLYPLESADLRLFFQTGVVWGAMETTIKEDTYNVTASGSNLGYLVGVGVQLMFGPHGITLEGGWRYLPIERNIVDSTTGTPAADSISQTDVNNELEFDNRDLSTTLTGSQMLVAYTYQF